MGGRPNIIFLMDDQRRWDALGCQQSILQTPSLDRLAREGIRFPQAVCHYGMISHIDHESGRLDCTLKVFAIDNGRDVGQTVVIRHNERII